MEPWENEEDKLAWRRALMPLGATERQADIARLVHAGLENKEIGARQGTSVSTVKTDIQVLFGILGVVRRKRHVMGESAWRLVEAAPGKAEPPASAPPRPGVAASSRRRKRPAALR
jgi:DNA-binding CsgD family transcriptional regulator